MTIEYTKTHCLVLCDLRHLIASERLDNNFTNTRFYDEVLKHQSGQHCRFDDLSEKCGGFGHIEGGH